MKRIAILILLLPGLASAADLTCTVPAASVTRAVELCDELRLELKIRTAEWDNDVCATQFLRVGLRSGERRSTEKASRRTVRDDLDIAISAFDTDWPRLIGASCGDGTLDTEFGETCDDGNREIGDGCDDSCQIE